MRKKHSPNLLLVFSDQHRWYDLTCDGNMEVKTPHLDALAQRGMRCELAVANSPLCVPSRASLLTGQHALRHGALGNDLPIRIGIESIADVFKRAGYRTGYVGKWHLAGVPRDAAVPEEKRLGFVDWKVTNCQHKYFESYYHDENNMRHEIEGYEPETHTRLAEDFIKEHTDTPWLLILSWGPPHDPYHPAPEPWRQFYAERDISLRKNTSNGLSPATIQNNLKGYYAHISALDALFGRLGEQLKTSGQLDQTMLVYTSDHGDMLGSQGYRNKQLPYEESIRVPLIVAGPGISAGSKWKQPFGLVDLAPTLAGCCGLQFETATDGLDRSKSWKDVRMPGQDDEEIAYLYELTGCHQAVGAGISPWRGIRTKTHTYATDAEGTPWLLFDNVADPFQIRNLVNDLHFSDLRKSLHAKLTEFVERYDRFGSAEKIICNAGLRDAWNTSQKHFGLPEISMK